MMFRVSAVVLAVSAAGNLYDHTLTVSQFDADTEEDSACDYVHELMSRCNPEVKDYALRFELLPATLH